MIDTDVSLFGVFAAGVSDVTYDREPISMDDGGTISLDWYPARQHEAQPGAKAQPIAIIIPGVCGSSQEHHVRSMAKILANEKAHKDRRYRVAVINYRGTGKTMLTSSRINGAHDTDDLNNIVQHIRRLDPGTPLVAIGFSLGANILTRYLGETKNESPFVAAVSICCPFDLEIAGRAVDARGFLNDNVFQPNLITAVKRAVRRNSEFIKTSDVGYDVDAILASKRMSEIDTLLMAKQCGYKNCWEYYRAASSVPHVDDIRTPYLAINALDDPVTPFGGIPVDKFTTNPFTALVLLKHGGHLGFFTGLKPQIWYLEPIREFFDVFAFRPEN
ncbi:hypothetical protein GGI07_000389 [Coemansia sp. Benny D115]|nr:hypothetical protein GGI07_000389 [Coemansia sp. Benny D115]